MTDSRFEYRASEWEGWLPLDMAKVRISTLEGLADYYRPMYNQVIYPTAEGWITLIAKDSVWFIRLLDQFLQAIWDARHRKP